MVLATAAGCDVTAYHVDHGLREGSAREPAVVARAAERCGAKFVALRVSCASGANLEARARAARFAALPAGVATGHTADDQAETILVNLLRGAGSDGLRGMSFGPTHPLLKLRRAQTHALVRSLDFEVVQDPSNDDTAFVRNRIRHELLPLAAEISRRDLVPVLTRQAQLIADETMLLDRLADEVDPTDVAALRDCDIALARRALRRWLRTFVDPPYVPGLATVERILEVARGEVRACEVGNGFRIRRSKGRLHIEPSGARADAASDAPEVAD